MRYYVLLVLVTAATFATSALAFGAVVAAAWPRLRERLPAGAACRARLLATLRLAPVCIGGAAAVLLSATFVRFEPRNTAEEPGLLLLTAASLTLGYVAAAVMRSIAAARLSRQCDALLQTSGRRHRGPDGSNVDVWVIDTDYPVAAVMGVLRTRLLLSRRILEELTEAEAALVVRHELGHVRRRDNLVQAAMRFLPDPFAPTRTAISLQRAWAQAAEEAADDRAAQDPRARTDLASALVRVAGMADGHPPRWMPTLTFVERSTIESRVRRLLVTNPASSGNRAWIPVVLVGLGFAAVLATESIGLRLHTLMEAAVQALP